MRARTLWALAALLAAGTLLPPEASAQRIKRRPVEAPAASPAPTAPATPPATAPAASTPATPVAAPSGRLRRRPGNDAAAPAAPAPSAPTTSTAGGLVLEVLQPGGPVPAAGPEPATPTALTTAPPTVASSASAVPASSELSDLLRPAPAGPPLGPLGHTGSGRVRRTGQPPSADFLPVEDRWRIGFPDYELYERGSGSDPYGQNVLKGDYPFDGQNTFLNLSVVSDTLLEKRRLPTPSGSSNARPESKPFFGDGSQQFFKTEAIATIDVFHGNTAFKPVDWRLRLTPVFNLENKLSLEEVGAVLPDVRGGKERSRDDVAFQEAFVEIRLADVSPNFDFVSTRIGRQPFASDFRGFLFNDTNNAVRLFGTAESNRVQYNLAYFKMLEKEINSDLNTGDDRGQQVAIANVYRQDLFVPGYTGQLSLHYNHDDGRLKYDENGFLQRPANIGTVDPAGGHSLESWYLGWTGDGHIGKLNVSHAYYVAKGHDSFNPLAGRRIDIDARMAAVELSEDRDWLRLKASYLWASGDRDPSDGRGEGFSAILDNPNFAGGGFSFLSRQGVRLTNVSLFSPNSLFPDLRSSKFQGMSNFVNPGLRLVGLGAEAELTPKVRLILNGNMAWFDKTQSLETLLNQAAIHQAVGMDLSIGAQYRPKLSQNVILTGGFNYFIPRAGFIDIYGSDTNLFSAFGSLTLAF
ncbi:MAG: hypothetical protein HY303_07620 [Candidatus Wallbacteria bacterium]|nr:hypothetical protein [Candidatus Wallbacteria bacterium]